MSNYRNSWQNLPCRALRPIFEEMFVRIWAEMVASCILLLTVVQSVASWMKVGINASMSDFCCYILEYAMESSVDGEYPPTPDSNRCRSFMPELEEKVDMLRDKIIKKIPKQFKIQLCNREMICECLDYGEIEIYFLQRTLKINYYFFFL